MLDYLDLDSLETKTIADGNEIITKGVSIKINENMNINEIMAISEDAVKNLLADLNPDKIYNFAFDLIREELPEEVFETVVNVLVAAFFQGMRIDEGRPRERRLDAIFTLASFSQHLNWGAVPFILNLRRERRSSRAMGRDIRISRLRGRSASSRFRLSR